MSREAQQWVAQLPAHATRTLVAFRVLDKLADAHHTDTDHAYRDVGKLADELVVSVRTVQRALRDLERAQLLIPGDQRALPRTVPANRAPTVYRLPWRTAWRATETLPGVTTGDTSQPVDNSARGDNTPVLGVTPGVAHRTQEPMTREESRPQYAREALSRCLDGTDEHAYSGRTRACVYCGHRRPERVSA